MLPGEAESAIEACDELEELGDVLQLRAASGQHNAANQLVSEPRASDFIVHVLDDFSHARFDDLGEGL